MVFEVVISAGGEAQRRMRENRGGALSHRRADCGESTVNGRGVDGCGMTRRKKKRKEESLKGFGWELDLLGF